MSPNFNLAQPALDCHCVCSRTIQSKSALQLRDDISERRVVLCLPRLLAALLLLHAQRINASASSSSDGITFAHHSRRTASASWLCGISRTVCSISPASQDIVVSLQRSKDQRPQAVRLEGSHQRCHKFRDTRYPLLRDPKARSRLRTSPRREVFISHDQPSLRQPDRPQMRRRGTWKRATPFERYCFMTSSYHRDPASGPPNHSPHCEILLVYSCRLWAAILYLPPTTGKEHPMNAHPTSA